MYFLVDGKFIELFMINMLNCTFLSKFSCGEGLDGIFCVLYSSVYIRVVNLLVALGLSCQ